MLFPERTADFVRTRVIKFAGSRENFGVGYAHDSLPLLVTIYIYPAEEAHFDEHFSDMVTDVSRSHGAAPVQQSPIEVKQADNVVRGRAATWQYKQAYGPNIIEVRSRGFLFHRGHWFVKYRVTNALDVDDNVREAVEGLMASLAMPSGT
jgi:hypothetical protein